MSLFFIALLPPQEIQDYATQVKQHFADKYNSRHAFKSPPHITLQPPFEWMDANLSVLEECLREFAAGQNSFPIKLNGYGAFIPRVIYINVEKTPHLLGLQNELMAHLENRLGIFNKISKTRPFTPHMTVAFKDLKRKNFWNAWEEFKGRELHFEFTVDKLTLLLHNGRYWNTESEFLLKSNSFFS